MVGLQTFLPQQHHDSPLYHYHLWQSPLPLLTARLAFSGVGLPVLVGRYRFAKKKSGSFSVFDFAETEA